MPQAVHHILCFLPSEATISSAASSNWPQHVRLMGQQADAWRKLHQKHTWPVQRSKVRWGERTCSTVLAIVCVQLMAGSNARTEAHDKQQSIEREREREQRKKVVIICAKWLVMYGNGAQWDDKRTTTDRTLTRVNDKQWARPERERWQFVTTATGQTGWQTGGALKHETPHLFC